MWRRPAPAPLDRANQPVDGREVPGFILGAEVRGHDAGVHIVCSDARPGKLSGEAPWSTPGRQRGITDAIRRVDPPQSPALSRQAHSLHGHKEPDARGQNCTRYVGV